MAIASDFYINAADLPTATSVYLDAALTLISPDGFYGDGTIIRQQSGGILLASVPYASCENLCDLNIVASGDQGLYTMSIDVGATIGAIIISFDPENIPDGILADHDGNSYNKLSSPIDGVHQSATPGNFTIIGNTGDTGTCSSTWYPAGGTVYLSQFDYDAPVFVPVIGAPVPVVIDAGDISLDFTSPGLCIMVVPKTSALATNIDVSVMGPCGSTGWDIKIGCPILLPEIKISNKFLSASISCGVKRENGAFFAKVHTAADSYIGLYDYVFTDENGEFPLADGYYLTANVASPNKVIQIQDGIVRLITNCVP
jgi:hypothetical protein